MQQQLVSLLLKSSTVKTPTNTQTAVIYGSSRPTDVQPRTWINQPLLELDLVLLRPTGWSGQRVLPTSNWTSAKLSST